MRPSMIISGFTVPLVLALAAGNGLAGLPGPVAGAAARATTSVMSWGDNSAGELGNGTLTAGTTPVAVGGSGGLQAISAGGRHVLGLLANGTVLSWGDDTSGQIGNGKAGGNAENPVAVNGLTGVTQVSAGTPNTGTEGSQLRAIHTFSSNDIWAVGTTQQTDGALLALIEHFNGTQWAISPALDPGQIGPVPDNNLTAVASPAPKTLWAVGTQEIASECCVRTLALMTSQG